MEPAGPEVTVAFAQLIEQRLAQQTLAALSAALLHQNTLRLTAGDLEVFTGGPAIRPGAVRILPIPPLLWEDLGALLASVRQHLLLVRRGAHRPVAWHASSFLRCQAPPATSAANGVL